MAAINNIPAVCSIRNFNHQETTLLACNERTTSKVAMGATDSGACTGGRTLCGSNEDFHALKRRLDSAQSPGDVSCQILRVLKKIQCIVDKSYTTPPRVAVGLVGEGSGTHNLRKCGGYITRLPGGKAFVKPNNLILGQKDKTIGHMPMC